VKAARYLAHSMSRLGHIDPVRDHLSRVGDRAAQYAGAFGAGDEARAAGLLHDLGKYGDLFQRRLEGKEQGIDHWSAGAWHGLTALKQNGVAVALAVQGHHIGLRQASKDALALLDPNDGGALLSAGLRRSSPDQGTLLERFQGDGLSLAGLEVSVYDTSRHLIKGLESAAGMLDVRMLFSALVDADFEETEAHFKGAVSTGAAPRVTGPPLTPGRVLNALLAHIDTLGSRYDGSPAVLALRQDLLTACLTAAQQKPGLFTLTAPTGSGKTLSMLAFALRHALQNDLRRVVIVVPYLTIIEQTVEAYRTALAPALGDVSSREYVLEDHSLAGSGALVGHEGTASDEQDLAAQRARELAENWDAPMVVTTSVQFLESLFANRSSACRKLHRLARSVILVDEVQTLPKDLAVATLATVGRLVERYGSTVVFSTATQPAFSHLDEHVRTFCGFGWAPKEVVPEGAALFRRIRRVQIVWPERDEHKSWQELAGELASSACPQALCIVNLKRHALALFREMDERMEGGLFHLSTNMCPAHRGQVLDEVRRRLAASDRCVLVSTQCVEAGVDLDFPTVYRAFGPLDAVAQAAGRCNRNGRQQSGIVHVFDPLVSVGEHCYPDGAYRQAADVTRMLLEASPGRHLDIDEEQTFETYFRALYGVARPQNCRSDIADAIKTQDFEEVAKLYRLIEKDAVNVLVPYDESEFTALRDRACRYGVTREWAMAARPQSVGLFRPPREDPVWSYLEPLPLAGRSRSDAWFVYTRREDYHRDVGLIPSTSLNCLIA
jgi:CRISPR-associated endonuclease/helicase Cas3